MKFIQPTGGSSIAFDQGHVPWLDGLRGIAALWVVISHVQILSGMRSIPVLSWGALAVDLFMMLSGFLMTYHYAKRRDVEPWASPSTWATFWARRFFRIAPLYYLLLIAALAIGPYIGDYRHAIAELWPATATTATRYYDHSPENFLMHASFAFGAFPQFAFRTPLPDWSIGLEMQFYLTFPFLMLAIARVGAIRAGLAVIVLCVAASRYFGDFFQQFEMPSFLPMKLYMFFIGMWVALSWQKKSMRGSLFASVIIAIAICTVDRTFESVGRILMVVAMFYLMSNGTLPSVPVLDVVVGRIRRLFSSPLASFLGDTSYSVYLVHLLILLPVSGSLARHSWYVELPAVARFGVCFLLTAPFAYFFGWLLYRTVEKPGIRIGKWAIKLFNQREIQLSDSRMATASKSNGI
ncbi:MAG: acyltransferase [Pseudomonadota bacterium]